MVWRGGASTARFPASWERLWGLMPLWLGLLVALATLILMEGVAYAAHRWLMHGAGWPLHRSHHSPPTGRLEANDWYAAIFALPSIALFLLAGRWGEMLWWIGAGIAAYGLVYAGFHDIIVHRRLPHRYLPRSRYMKRIVQAHRLHHAVRTREGAVSFGFLWAPRPALLKARLRRSAAGNSGRTEAPVQPAPAPRATPSPPA